MFKKLALCACVVAGQAYADEDSVKTMQVVPYCQSSIELMCEVYVEYIQRDPSMRLVPPHERNHSQEYLHIELRARWVNDNDLEGQIVWWGKSGEEYAGIGSIIEGAPDDPRAYVHLIGLSLQGAGLPSVDSPFYSYARW
jgi:hypothetical protein